MAKSALDTIRISEDDGSPVKAALMDSSAFTKEPLKFDRQKTYAVPEDPRLQEILPEEQDEPKDTSLIKTVEIPKLMFRENSTFTKLWDVLIIILAIYNAFVIPL